jgi:hypothetical protein
VLTIDEKYLAVAEAAERLRSVREHYATLAEVLRDPWAQAQLEEIETALRRLRKEAARLERERSGAGAEGGELLAEAERYFEGREFTSKVEGEFLGMLDGLLVGPVLPGTEERVGQALTTIRSKYGPAAVEHCKRLISPAAPGPLGEGVG